MITIKRVSVENENGEREKVNVFNEEGNLICSSPINKDNEGREYYDVDNINDKDGFFTDKPKDAIECIQKGYGDAITKTNIFGMSFMQVIRYLDREYGEEVRQKTLEGWADVEFAFGVKFRYKDAMNSGYYVCKNEDLFGFDNKPDDILTFDMVEEAESYIKKVNDTVKAWHKEYEHIKEMYADDEEKKEAEINHFFTSYDSSMSSVYWSGFRGYKSENEIKYRLYVVQVAK